MSARPYSPLKYSYIPRDPSEIDHVLYLLEQDVRPEGRRSPARFSLLRAVRDDLQEAFQDHYEGAFTCKTWSDYAYAAESRYVNDWAQCDARAIARLYALESAAEGVGLQEDDPPFRSWPHWDELRQALIEVALWLVTFESADNETKRRGAAAYILELEGVAKQAEILRQGRRRGSLAEHTKYLVDLIQDYPGLTAKELAKLVREQRDQPDCPFDFEGDEVLLRGSDKSINLVHAINNVRKRHKKWSFSVSDQK